MGKIIQQMQESAKKEEALRVVAPKPPAPEKGMISLRKVNALIDAEVKRHKKLENGDEGDVEYTSSEALLQLKKELKKI